MSSGGEIVKICGFLASFKYGIHALLHTKVPLILIELARSNYFAFVSSTRLLYMAEALLIQISIPPNSFTV